MIKYNLCIKLKFSVVNLIDFKQKKFKFNNYKSFIINKIDISLIVRKQFSNIIIITIFTPKIIKKCLVDLHFLKILNK